MTHSSPETATDIAADAGVLRVSFPARSGFLRISRMNATAFAADLDFDVDELDDLRLAVDEVVTWLLIDPDPGGTITLEFSTVANGVQFSAERRAEGLPARELDDLVNAILGATVDGHDYSSAESGVRRVVFDKRHVPS